MEQFNYLSILVSIIIGLAIAQVLTGLGRLIQARARVLFYWPSVAWAGLFLVINVETWWALFRLRGAADWNFFAFLLVIAHPIGLFLICSLILPDPGEFASAPPVDLRANYFDHRRWFFGLIILVAVARLARPLAAAGQSLHPLDIGVQVIIILAAAVAAITRRAWVHLALAPAAIALLSVYYALVYVRLA